MVMMVGVHTELVRAARAVTHGRDRRAGWDPATLSQ